MTQNISETVARMIVFQPRNAVALLNVYNIEPANTPFYQTVFPPAGNDPIPTANDCVEINKFCTEVPAHMSAVVKDWSGVYARNTVMVDFTAGQRTSAMMLAAAKMPSVLSLAIGLRYALDTGNLSWLQTRQWTAIVRDYVAISSNGGSITLGEALCGGWLMRYAAARNAAEDVEQIIISHFTPAIVMTRQEYFIEQAVDRLAKGGDIDLAEILDDNGDPALPPPKPKRNYVPRKRSQAFVLTDGEAKEARRRAASILGIGSA